MKFDPTITQKVRVAIEDDEARTTLDRQVWRAVENNAAGVVELEKRVRMLEQAHADRLTETGVNTRITVNTLELKTSVKWLKLLLVGSILVFAADIVHGWMK